MRLMRIAFLVAAAAGVLGIDVGESVRAGSISDGSAGANPRNRRRHRKHRHKRRKKHRRHEAPPATEM
jgi:hypothetical protein